MIKLIFPLILIFALSGCDSAKEKTEQMPAAGRETDESVPAQITDTELIKGLEKAVIGVPGIYYQYHGDGMLITTFSDEGTPREFKAEFSGNPIDIEIIERPEADQNGNGTCRVRAMVANQFYRLADQHELEIHYSLSNDSVVGMSGKITDEQPVLVVPTIPFEMGYIYDQGTDFEYVLKDGVREELIRTVLSRENVDAVELSRIDKTSDFEIQGDLLITLENGLRMTSPVKLTYAPKEGETAGNTWDAWYYGNGNRFFLVK